MPFRVVPRSMISHLRVGNVVDGSVDTSTEPWTLRDVTVRAQTSLLHESLIHDVPLLGIGDHIPDVPLIDQRGRPFSLDALHGGRVVMAFIYTRCRDARMCPLISAKFHTLAGLIGKRRIHLVEVTLDPSFDRPSVLARYGEGFQADPKRWTLATGDPNTVLDFTARFGITTIDDEKFGIIHSERTVMIDAAGAIEELIDTTAWQPDEIIAQIDAENGGYANPVARFNLWLSSAAVAICGNRVGGFSGLTDLAIVFAIVIAFGYLLLRLARKIAQSP